MRWLVAPFLGASSTSDGGPLRHRDQEKHHGIEKKLAKEQKSLGGDQASNLSYRTPSSSQWS